MFEVMAPGTLSVPFTNTLVVVTLFDTTRFDKGWMNPTAVTLDRRPPSPTKRVAYTFVVVTLFDTYKLPVTWSFAVAAVDAPIPTFGT